MATIREFIQSRSCRTRAALSRVLLRQRWDGHCCGPGGRCIDCGQQLI